MLLTRRAALAKEILTFTVHRLFDSVRQVGFTTERNSSSAMTQSFLEIAHVSRAFKFEIRESTPFLVVANSSVKLPEKGLVKRTPEKTQANTVSKVAMFSNFEKFKV